MLPAMLMASPVLARSPPPAPPYYCRLLYQKKRA
jgi:hypothetical protein